MSKVKKAAVIGHPIGHSRSPLIHNYWLKKYNLEGEFSAIDTEPLNLQDTLKKLADEGYQGASVTLPHKETVMEFCDELDETAQAVKAVNMITFKKGKILGANTDVFGFIENIKTHYSGLKFNKGPATVLGAGGAARAVIYGLLSKKVPEIRLSNRTLDRAEILAREFPNVKVYPWEQRNKILNETLILVNTTSLGMKGQPALELDLQNYLHRDATVCDIVYNPLLTKLIMDGIRTKHKTVTGIGMLLHQARPAFKKWFGVMPEIDDQLKELALK